MGVGGGGGCLVVEKERLQILDPQRLASLQTLMGHNNLHNSKKPLNSHSISTVYFAFALLYS